MAGQEERGSPVYKALLWLRETAGAVTERLSGKAVRTTLKAILDSPRYQRFALQRPTAAFDVLVRDFLADEIDVFVERMREAERSRATRILRNEFNLDNSPDTLEERRRVLSDAFAAEKVRSPSEGSIRGHADKWIFELAEAIEHGEVEQATQEPIETLSGAPDYGLSAPSEGRVHPEPVLFRGASTPAGRLVIVTGISGSAVEPSIFAARQVIGMSSTAIVALEDYLVQAVRDLDDPGFNALLTGAHRTTTLFQRIPDTAILKAWPTAMEHALREVRRHVEAGETVFLRLHATYLHNESRSIFSALDASRLVPAIQSISSPALVICLIDDVLDTMRRLELPNQVLRGGVRSPARRSQTLLDILSWRQQEIRTTQLLARALEPDEGLESNFVVLPVKHDISAFTNLLVPGHVRVYLSHPITHFRMGGFDSDGRAGVDFVEGFAEALRGRFAEMSRALVLFEPTAIDELRLKAQRIGDRSGRGVALKVRDTLLLPRWPRRSEAMYRPGRQLCHQSQSARRSRTLCDAAETCYICGQIDPYVSIDLGESYSQLPHGGDQAPGLFIADTPAHLDIYAYEVMRQIGSRDRLLVSQSDAIVAVCPFAEGRIAEGMRIEIDFHTLVRGLLYRQSRDSFVVLPQEHDRIRTARALEAYVRSVAPPEWAMDRNKRKVMRSIAKRLTAESEDLGDDGNSELGSELRSRLEAAGDNSFLDRLYKTPRFSSTLEAANRNYGLEPDAAEVVGEEIARVLADDDEGWAWEDAASFSPSKQFSAWRVETIPTMANPDASARRIADALMV